MVTIQFSYHIMISLHSFIRIYENRVEKIRGIFFRGVKTQWGRYRSSTICVPCFLAKYWLVCGGSMWSSCLCNKAWLWSIFLDYIFCYLIQFLIYYRDLAALIDRAKTLDFDDMLYIVENSQHSHFQALFALARCFDELKNRYFLTAPSPLVRKTVTVFQLSFYDGLQTASFEQLTNLFLT